MHDSRTKSLTTLLRLKIEAVKLFHWVTENLDNLISARSTLLISSQPLWRCTAYGCELHGSFKTSATTFHLDHYRPRDFLRCFFMGGDQPVKSSVTLLTDLVIDPWDERSRARLRICTPAITSISRSIIFAQWSWSVFKVSLNCDFACTWKVPTILYSSLIQRINDSWYFIAGKLQTYTASIAVGLCSTMLKILPSFLTSFQHISLHSNTWTSDVVSLRLKVWIVS